MRKEFYDAYARLISAYTDVFTEEAYNFLIAPDRSSRLLRIYSELINVQNLMRTIVPSEGDISLGFDQTLASLASQITLLSERIDQLDQVVDQGANSEDLQNLIQTVDTIQSRLSSIEQSMSGYIALASRVTSIEQTLSSEGFWQFLLSNNLLEEKIVGGVMSIIVNQELMERSLIATGAFDDAGAGGDIVIGPQETIINVTSVVAANTPLSMLSSGTGYSVSGDTGYSVDSSDDFNASNRIRVVFDGIELDNGVDVFWHSESEIKFNVDLISGVRIVVHW